MSDFRSVTSAVETRPAPKEASASSCGKAIIVGEHAVVYGTHAVAIPLKQMRMHITIKPFANSLADMHAAEFHLKLSGKEVSSRIAGVIPDTLDLFEYPHFSLNAKGHSHLPIGAGLGSSASLCIAILRALAASTNTKLSTARLAVLANALEARFHGNPSGLDTMVVAHEAPVYFAKNQTKGVELIDVKKPESKAWHFALIDSKVRASTLSMIKIAEPYFKGPDSDKRLALFDDLAKAVKKGFESGDTPSVKDAMNTCHRLLKDAGVVTPPLESIIKQSLELGVLAAKTTGAGGGGSILCLLDPSAADEQFRSLGQLFGENYVHKVSL